MAVHQPFEGLTGNAAVRACVTPMDYVALIRWQGNAHFHPAGPETGGVATAVAVGVVSLPAGTDRFDWRNRHGLVDAACSSNCQQLPECLKNIARRTATKIVTFWSISEANITGRSGYIDYNLFNKVMIRYC